MASDITLAVGDGARRMTYAELADVRGISPASAKRLTQRHHWGRQIGNDGVVRVTVPLSALVAARKPKTIDVAPDTGLMSSATWATDPATPADVAAGIAGDVAPVVIPATETLALAVETLRSQLAIANGRADRAEQRIDEQQETIRHLRGLLAEERRRMLALLTAPERRPWWRHWFR
jgi:hypothetical protein